MTRTTMLRVTLLGATVALAAAVAHSAHVEVHPQSQGNAHEILVTSDSGWLTTGLHGWHPYAHSEQAPHNAPPAWWVAQLPACPDDSGGDTDAWPCKWDALHQGNHVGHSFWVDTRGTVHYLTAGG